MAHFDLQLVPEEIFSNILSFLTLREITTTSTVCSVFRHATLTSLPVQYPHNLSFKNRGFYPTEDYSQELNEFKEQYATKLFHNDKTTVEEIMYARHCIIGATIPALLDILMESLIEFRKKNLDEVRLPHDGSAIRSVFFYTYETFMTSQELLYMIFYRFEQSKDSPKDLIVLTLVLECWIRHYISQALLKTDSLSEKSIKLIRQLLHFIDKEMSPDDDNDARFAIYLRGLVLKNTIEQVIQETTVLNQLRRFPVDPAIYDETNLMKFPISEVARQLTILVFELVDKIEPHEFCGYPWRANRGQHKCPNIMNKLNNFEKLSSWVATEIVQPETAKERYEVLKYFMQLVLELYKIRCFDLVFCIIGGITSASVHRLKQTMDLMSDHDREIMSQFREIVSLRGNFENLRTHLLSCENNAALPYYGMFMGDLKYVHDTPLPSRFEKIQQELDKKGISFINWYFLVQEYQLISKLQRWRFEHSYYPLEGRALDLPDLLKISHIQGLIQAKLETCIPVQDLFELSLIREPR